MPLLIATHVKKETGEVATECAIIIMSRYSYNYCELLLSIQGSTKLENYFSHIRKEITLYITGVIHYQNKSRVTVRACWSFSRTKSFAVFADITVLLLPQKVANPRKSYYSTQMQ